MGIHHNDVALGLVGEKAGIGKTTFFELLVPQCLKEYYQVAQKDERIFSMPNSFTQRFLLNFDEFAAINKRNEEEFKLYMSASVIEIKRPGSRYAEKVPRVASCCFTSNKNHRMGGFISKPDNGLMRRLAVIEVDAIDDYRKRLDVDQLWAEAVLMLNNEDYAWTQEDFRQFTRENLKYIEVTNAMRLVKLYYRKPKANEEPKFMMASDVVFQLKQEKKITSSLQRIDDTSIGMALKALGFERYGKRTEKGVRYGYDVIPMFRK
jgi:predicted P-loop ATPase